MLVNCVGHWRLHDGLTFASVHVMLTSLVPPPLPFPPSPLTVCPHSAANKCLLKVAILSSNLDNYEKGAQIFEDVSHVISHLSAHCYSTRMCPCSPAVGQLFR